MEEKEWIPRSLRPKSCLDFEQLDFQYAVGDHEA